MHWMHIPGYTHCNFLRSVLCISLTVVLSISAFSQKNFIKGVVKDTVAKKGLHYSIVALIDLADSVLYRSFRSNESGEFEIKNIPPGKYTVMISYPRMADFLQQITIEDTSRIDLHDIIMVPEAVLLQEVVVRSAAAIRMRGDTLEYIADSFALRPGSNVEELLKRLPGIHVDRNGKIIAQGKEVQQVLVDGDEFFSDDPGLATKYLNADAVDKVQVFDQKSEQSEFTGIDDGSRTKTINLQLKKNRKNGYFGKLAAGTDATQYYNHEAMGALFNEGKKISVFGMSSKTGKTDISGSELSQYVAQDYERIDDGTGSVYFSGIDSYEGDGYYSSGLPSVIYGGAHYSDKWKGGKQKLFTNYRIKQVNSSGWSNGSSLTVLPDGTSFSGKNNSTEASHSFFQKGSGNFTTPLDTFSILKMSVGGSLGNNTRNSSSNSESKNEKGVFVNKNIQSNTSDAENKRFGTNIGYQHKFKRSNRTLSLQFQQDYSEGNKDNYNYSVINLYDPASGNFINADTLDQLQKSSNIVESYAARAVFTDKLSKATGYFVEYGWKTSLASNIFKTLNIINGKYEELVDTLSNDYRFRINTHITGAGFSWNKKKFNVTVGAKVFFTGFIQTNNDTRIKSKRQFTNLAPNAGINITLNEKSFFSFNYYGQTFQPSVDQLQPLRKSNSQLYVEVGNADLRPGFNHSGGFSYNWFDWPKGRNLFAYFNLNYTTNNIIAKTSTDAQGRTVNQYINMNGIPGMSGNINYSWQYKKLNLRPSVGTSINRYAGYSVLNNQKVKNESFSGSFNIGLQYEWANKLTANYGGVVNYSSGRSDIVNATSNSNLSHTHRLNITGYLPAKMEVSSDCFLTFQPKNKTFDSHLNIIQWNASLQKKLLKSEKAILKLSVSDILNQNTGYYRGVYGSNIYESNHLTVKRYWLLSLVWNFSKSINNESNE